jgi:hypothetical protein
MKLDDLLSEQDIFYCIKADSRMPDYLLRIKIQENKSRIYKIVDALIGDETSEEMKRGIIAATLMLDEAIQHATNHLDTTLKQ